MVRLHKKGVEMQVFYFLFALILIALILGYGLKSVVRLKSVSDDVDLGDFVFRLRDEVNSMQSFDVGSSKNVRLFLPEKVEQVCFYNGKREVRGNVDPSLRNYLDTNIGKNVFVTPFSFAQNIFLIEHLRPAGQDNPLCFSPRGNLQFTLETVLGDDGKVYVEVRR